MASRQIDDLADDLLVGLAGAVLRPARRVSQAASPWVHHVLSLRETHISVRPGDLGLVTLRQLEVFLALRIAKHEHVGRAADDLHLLPSAASSALSSLEGNIFANGSAGDRRCIRPTGFDAVTERDDVKSLRNVSISRAPSARAITAPRRSWREPHSPL